MVAPKPPGEPTPEAVGLSLSGQHSARLDGLCAALQGLVAGAGDDAAEVLLEGLRCLGEEAPTSGASEGGWWSGSLVRIPGGGSSLSLRSQSDQYLSVQFDRRGRPCLGNLATTSTGSAPPVAAWWRVVEDSAGRNLVLGMYSGEVVRHLGSADLELTWTDDPDVETDSAFAPEPCFPEIADRLARGPTPPEETKLPAEAEPGLPAADSAHQGLPASLAAGAAASLAAAAGTVLTQATSERGGGRSETATPLAPFSASPHPSDPLPTAACSRCGAPLGPDSRFCKRCGAPAPTPSPACQRCRAPLGPDSRFCKRCGAPVPSTPPPRRREDDP